MKDQVNFFWFRRDLRLEDNVGLYHALKSGSPVRALFIFDSEILDRLENKRDARLVFIQHQLVKINLQLQIFGSSLLVEYGRPIDIWKKIVKENSVGTVFSNRDYEPYAITRDKEVESFLKTKNITT